MPSKFAVLAGMGTLIGETFIQTGMETAVANYLAGGSSPSISSIPMGRKGGSKSSPKIAKKAGLAQYSDAIGAGLAVVAGAVMVNSSTSISSAESVSSTNKAELDNLKSLNPESPLLQNQLHLKQSVNDIVDALNANAIISATFLAPINSNLTAIASTLIAISSTLLEISDNYSSTIEKSEDLPYLDTSNFYDLLSQNPNLSQLAVTQIRSGEMDMISKMSLAGASFSEIKQAIKEFRNINVPAGDLIDVHNATAGLTQQSPITSTGASSGVSSSPVSSATSINVKFPDKMNVTLPQE